MELPPSARLHRTSAELRGEVARLAAEVFDGLAQGRDAVNLEVIAPIAAQLGQLSVDFVTDADEVLTRMDQNGDNLIQRDEFFHEIQSIAELIGVRDAVTALGAVVASLGRPADAANTVAASNTGEATNPVPVTMLDTKGRVLEKMIGYFSAMREEYSKELEEVKTVRERRAGEEETAGATPPDPPRIFSSFATAARRAPANSTGPVFSAEHHEEEPESAEEEDADGEEAAEDEEAEASGVEEEDEDDAEDAEEEEEQGDDAEEEEDEENAEDETETTTPAVFSTATRSRGSEKPESEKETPPTAPSLSSEVRAGVAAADADHPTSPVATPTLGPADTQKGRKKSNRRASIKAKAKVKPKPKPTASPPPRSSTSTPRPASSPSPPPGQEPSSRPPPAPAKVARPPKTDEEGVQCIQTLEMGLAVRSAICIGHEVWTVDWKGAVTIRERDDASKIRGEVPTNRFVWAMAHMEPGLMWMGQEAQGVSLFDSKKKEFRTSLVGGHTGGVTCIALDDALGDEENGAFPRRRAWSGSNDFTIRQWWIDTWWASKAFPAEMKQGGQVVALGQYKVGISRGQAMHGHKNGVRALLRIGPMLWSGSDDGTIRLWTTSDGECTEVVEAHQGSVLKLVIVRSYVWSAGADGLVKEWTMGGKARVCVRQVAPAGAEKGVYAVVPLGHDVWVAGHHPAIQVFSQTGMEQTSQHIAHEPWVSNLLSVDTVFTRVVWSTSIGDRKLKVWKHTLRGAIPSLDEMKAANRLYEDEEQKVATRMGNLVRKNSEIEDELEISADQYKRQLDGVTRDLIEKRTRAEDLDKKLKHLEDEMAGLRRLFEDAGLGHLLHDPEALKKFLDMKRIFDAAGLSHLLTDPAALERFLNLNGIFAEAGLDGLLEDPEALRAFLGRASRIEEVLRSLGLDRVLGDPEKLRKLLTTLLELQQLFEGYGLDDVLNDPSLLAGILSRYSGLRDACEHYGYPEFFEDPYNLKGFLRIYTGVRDVCKEAGVEHLFSSSVAMREFLQQHGQGEAELQELRLRTRKFEEMEATLRNRDAELAKALEELKDLRGHLAEFQELGDVESLSQAKAQASAYRSMEKAKRDMERELFEMKVALEEKEKERQEALERERMMALKYKELDIFKLDIIARELKSLDQELGLVGKGMREVEQHATKLRNLDEQQELKQTAEKPLEGMQALRGHIRDVINKCLSETQKMHIGIAIDDHLAAGQLKEGGVMAGYVVEEVYVPDHGRSKAARLRQSDEMTRERTASKGRP